MRKIEKFRILTYSTNQMPIYFLIPESQFQEVNPIFLDNKKANPSEPQFPIYPLMTLKVGWPRSNQEEIAKPWGCFDGRKFPLSVIILRGTAHDLRRWVSQQRSREMPTGLPGALENRKFFASRTQGIFQTIPVQGFAPSSDKRTIPGCNSVYRRNHKNGVYWEMG